MEDASVTIKDTTSNPAPLGLLGFGMTTVLLNLHNAGFYSLDAMILSMGIFYGGIAQAIAGVMEWKKNNMFGATAFTSYGFFWLTLVGIILIPNMGLPGMKPSDASFGAYLFMWGVFTAAMFIGTLRANKAIQLVFGSLVILFFLLAAGHWTLGSNPAVGNAIIKIAGYEGIVCGASAIYAAVAQILNEVYKKTVLPLG